GNDVSDLLDTVRNRRFSMTLDGLGVFGGKRPRAVWARVVPNPELLILQMELEQICQRAGLNPETRKYTPHVTLARLRGSSSMEVAHYLSGNGNFFCANVPVTRFALYSAKPSKGGGPYLIERAYPLSEPSGIAEMLHESGATGVEHI
ncbi:MAG: RNA 2',3'-cyclic phosphodiesterase, partial [Fimbriimonadaceae bacterium]|nr:RNA 2',3'-cyclic phosphodiesterase [Alphaproteobacteria bacterium]